MLDPKLLRSDPAAVAANLARRGLQGFCGSGDKCREGTIGAGHHTTSIGVFGFFESNSPKPVFPEQPSPNEKPQEPRI